MAQARTNPWLVLVVLTSGFFMILLDTTIVNVAIPAMSAGLNTTLDQILWVLNAYILVYAVLLITAGRLGDLYGQRNLFAIGLLIFTVASALCGLSQNAGELIAARVLQGIGGAILTPQTLAIITTLFPPERRGAASAWWGHVPFAHWVMRAVRPRVLVELGTHNGVSYAAFCEAVARCQLNTRCFAVDTWKGDAHASFYDERVYEDFKAFHDARYAAFSTLLRATFDEALERIEDGSVDLLHLDGLHTYDAVQHDFVSWLPKLSSHGVALLHDINVHNGDFAVWRLWQELRERHPHFEFHHSYGLGVLALGKEPPEAISESAARRDATPERAR